MFSEDIHLLFRTAAGRTRGQYKTRCGQIAALAVIAYLRTSE